MNQLTSTVTMTSLELVDFINSQRGEGEAELRHDHFMAKVPKVLGDTAPKFSGTVQRPQPAGGVRDYPCYRLPKREACLMAMSYSYDLQAKVFDRMTALEQSAKPVLALPDFSNPAAAARAWAAEYELRTAANEALAIAAPKAAFVDQYVDSTGLKGFRQVAKLLKANEARFREFLLDKKIMYRLGGEWHAHQPHIDAARFDVKTGTSEHSQHAYTHTMFTPKGVEWIVGLWAVQCMKEAA
ncbi:Phage antirepressor protein YoqD, KilAC domain [Polaromonas sp. OV174]|uniref:phage antirepressor KilAC domain-containing protein n=1 Tax=Polaromonas sp. OV174 TaxID=1855300 RepID=UPI0008EE369B|nr:phage antirepressor KilAC domain-containing protein [Polaromonas sp. OV174]SFB74478.1 Phage antirepressor protein YoqD, KilAC domain [Polaromonas sp. OV174]